MTYTPPVRYTADEIAAAVEPDPDEYPEHTCGDSSDDECVACQWEDGERGWSEIAYGDPGDISEILLKGEKVKVIYIDGESGGEGSGESVWAIIKVGVQYFKKTGYYMSHDGTHWDGDVTEVKRKQRTVTFYE